MTVRTLVRTKIAIWHRSRIGVQKLVESVHQMTRHVLTQEMDVRTGRKTAIIIHGGMYVTELVESVHQLTRNHVLTTTKNVRTGRKTALMLPICVQRLVEPANFKD